MNYENISRICRVRLIGLLSLCTISAQHLVAQGLYVPGGAVADSGTGSVVLASPYSAPWGFGLQTHTSWGAWARQYAFLSSDGTQIAALMATGQDGRSLSRLSLGRGLDNAGNFGPEWLTIASNGDVGINTDTPTQRLDVRGEVMAIDNGSLNYGGNVAFKNSIRHWRAGMLGAPGWDRFSIFDATAGAERFAIDTAGNVGIGRVSTADRLEVSGGIRSYKDGGDAVTAQLYFANVANDRAWNWQTTANGGSSLWGYDGSAWAEKMRVAASGNVGIGTTAPSHKLSVNGTIKAKEVIVETTGWSDYIFADDYRLAPLSEVEAHIKAERRLPGIPSEQQVAEQGVGVGEMQALLLAKIEEMTLRQIQQEREIRALRAEVARLRGSSQ